MNIQIATVYAQQGYRIFREPSWRNSLTGEIVKSIYIDNDRWMIDSVVPIESNLLATLTPKDCLADDWSIIQ